MHEQARRTSWIMLTGELRSTHSNSGPSAAYFNIIPKQTGQVSSPGPHGKRPATNCQRHGTAQFVHNSLDSFYNGMFTTEWTNGPVICVDYAAFI